MEQKRDTFFSSLKNIIILGLLDEQFFKEMEKKENSDFTIFVNLVYFLKKSFEDTLIYFVDKNKEKNSDIFSILKDFQNQNNLNNEECQEDLINFKYLIEISDYNPAVFDEVYPLLKKFFTFLGHQFDFEFPCTKQTPVLYYNFENQKFKNIDISFSEVDRSICFRTLPDELRQTYFTNIHTKTADGILQKWINHAINFSEETKEKINLLTNTPENFLGPIFLYAENKVIMSPNNSSEITSDVSLNSA